MDESTIDLLKRIRLGEDSSLELQDLRFRGDQVADPHRHSMADEFAAMANTGSGTFVLGVDDKLKTVVGIPLDKLDVVERSVVAAILILGMYFLQPRQPPPHAALRPIMAR
ncbi:hypothetical protein FRD01_07875 [Microvenator marinus]|uniref:Schlafen AlbA-2 domain-containing protein n=1 Tax=Microvenator marinus TaxID=2600177 RepID=A0A5B8XMT2_9DELT|nr:RNA-binding domain-containing protein [Microvenator marinus]QED27162.1 hypothetical protein FRD01_07875 [Microvenator marinus]